ncbi:MAG: bifunctional precorrin-2 dehydrogenase/sirohydrochlorin ferrochelatase [Chloroflexi bacterium]|nr:bifunctional precorrin-2 dehydrogenase/sirohydrochlorin ferrochelatase [Chloroflexota bacterium]
MVREAKMPAYYPAFLDLRGRRCVVIGAGDVAERKVAMLLKAGAKVTVVSPEGTVELASLSKAGKIEWRRRAYQFGDLSGAWLAIAATDDASVNRQIADEAEAGHVLLNVVDKPDLCTFIAPSVVQQGDLTIAISTAGKSPAMARKVREEMERYFPPEYGVLLDIAGEVREMLMREPGRPPAELWQQALSEEVLDLIRVGRRDAARNKMVKILRNARAVAS